MMRAKSGHIIFEYGFRYSDLAPIFPKIFEAFLDVTGQRREDEPELDRLLLELNMRDLEKNKKPEGYNRPGIVRMIFPLTGRVEIYIYADTIHEKVVRATREISSILEDEGIAHEVKWDSMFLDELRRRKQAKK